MLQWHFWAIGIAILLSYSILSGRAFRLPSYSIPYIAWCTGFMVICLMSLLFVSSNELAMEGFTSYVWYFASSLALVIFVRSIHEIKMCGWAVVTSLIVLGIITLFEFYNPEFQAIVTDEGISTKVNRASSLYSNQNVTGIVLVLGAFIGQMFIKRSLRFAFLCFIGVAVLGTVSRGALTLWSLALLGSFWFGYLSKNRLYLKLLGISFIALLGTLLVSGQIPVILENAGMGNLLNANMTDRLSGNFFTQQDNSTTARTEAALEGFDIFVDNPLFGVGIDGILTLPITGIGPHNQHIKVAAELGMLGWLAYLLLFLVALSTRTVHALMFVSLFFIISFTAHWLLNFTVFGIYLAIAMVHLPALTLHQRPLIHSRHEKRRRKKKKRRHKAGYPT